MVPWSIVWRVFKRNDFSISLNGITMDTNDQKLKKEYGMIMTLVNWLEE